MTEGMKGNLFQLSELLRFFMEEGYSVQDMGTGHGLQVVPTDFFVETPESYHVYPHMVLRSVRGTGK